jgi:hypothetical protein
MNLDHARDAIRDFHATNPKLCLLTSLCFATSNSSPDVILAIYPEHVASLVSGTKSHGFHKYHLSPDARFLWLYETAPMHTIHFIIEVDAPLLPGQVLSSGLGNTDFNDGLKESEFAYPVLKVHHLPCPISASKLLDFAVSPPHHWCPASPLFVLCFGPLVGVQDTHPRWGSVSLARIFLFSFFWLSRLSWFPQPLFFSFLFLFIHSLFMSSCRPLLYRALFPIFFFFFLLSLAFKRFSSRSSWLDYSFRLFPSLSSDKTTSFHNVL